MIFACVLATGKVIYGDSVASSTPVIIRAGGRLISYVAIEDLADACGNNNWTSGLDGDTKEYCELPGGIEAWSDQGWTQVHRVIRHKLSRIKRMVRIQTDRALVDVTDDHSLLRSDGTPVSPFDVRLFEPLPGYEWRLESGVGGAHALRPYKEDVLDEEDVVAMYAEHCGSERAVPDVVLNSPLATRQAFWSGYLDASGGETSSSHLVVATMFALIMSIREPDQLPYVISADRERIVIEEPEIERDHALLRKIQIIPYSGYVYDLTTDNGHFAAGIGTMIVHNTDSIFVEYNPGAASTSASSGASTSAGSREANVLSAMEYGIAAQEAFRPHLKPPHDCEWEKVFYPFIIFSKKRYIGNVYDDKNRPDKCKLKCMGVVLKRRDNAPIVKTIYGGCIDILLNKHDIREAVTFLRDNLAALIDGKFPIDQLVVTKSLRANYKDPTRIAHKVLAERIGERDPGNKPQVYLTPLP